MLERSASYPPLQNIPPRALQILTTPKLEDAVSTLHNRFIVLHWYVWFQQFFEQLLIKFSSDCICQSCTCSCWTSSKSNSEHLINTLKYVKLITNHCSCRPNLRLAAATLTIAIDLTKSLFKVAFNMSFAFDIFFTFDSHISFAVYQIREFKIKFNPSHRQHWFHSPNINSTSFNIISESLVRTRRCDTNNCN